MGCSHQFKFTAISSVIVTPSFYQCCSDTRIYLRNFEIRIREYDSTLYVGMVQGVSNSQYIDIGTNSRKASKTAKTRLRRAKYEIFIH